MPLRYFSEKDPQKKFILFSIKEASKMKTFEQKFSFKNSAIKNIQYFVPQKTITHFAETQIKYPFCKFLDFITGH